MGSIWCTLIRWFRELNTGTLVCYFVKRKFNGEEDFRKWKNRGMKGSLDQVQRCHLALRIWGCVWYTEEASGSSRLPALLRMKTNLGLFWINPTLNSDSNIIFKSSPLSRKVLCMIKRWQVHTGPAHLWQMRSPQAVIWWEVPWLGSPHLPPLSLFQFRQREEENRASKDV